MPPPGVNRVNYYWNIYLKKNLFKIQKIHFKNIHFLKEAVTPRARFMPLYNKVSRKETTTARK